MTNSPVRRSSRFAAIAFLLLAAPVFADGVFIIQIRTDLTPGADFDEVWVDATRAETGRTLRYVHTVDPTRDYASGVRVAEFNINREFSERDYDTAHGEYRMIVSTRLGGAPVLERPVRAEQHDGIRVITVLIVRDFEPVRPVLERSLSIDLNGDGAAGPGDVVRSTMRFVAPHDMGDRTLFREDLDPSLLLDRDSVVFSHGEMAGPKDPDANEVTVRLGHIDEGQEATVEYEAVVNPVIESQGGLHVDGPLQYDVLTDDPDTPELEDPSVIPIACGEPNGNQCCGDLDVCDEKLAACELERDACTIGRGLCEEKLGAVAGDLARCEEKSAALVQANAALQQSLDALLADPDADGTPAARDDCPGTAPGAPVDAVGCSAEQFCAGVETDVHRWHRACTGSDWMGDEPGRPPRDCRANHRRRSCEAR